MSERGTLADWQRAQKERRPEDQDSVVQLLWNVVTNLGLNVDSDGNLQAPGGPTRQTRPQGWESEGHGGSPDD